MRLALGGFESFTAPCAYSLIADFFPAETRAIANAFFALGISVGGGLSAITLIIIGKVGWRATYVMLGIYGVVVGLLSLIFVREPARGKYELLLNEN